MDRQYSIAEARDQFPRIVHDVETGSPVELTRRGKPVAVIISIEEYRRLAPERKKDFWTAYQAWRADLDASGIEIEPEIFEGLRDRSPGREVDL